MSDFAPDSSTRTSDYFSGTSETSSETGPDISTRLADISAASSRNVYRNALKVVDSTNQKHSKCSTMKKKKDTIYQCPFCPYATLFASHYQNHTTYHDVGDEKNNDETRSTFYRSGLTFQCPYCTFRAKKSSGIQRHVKVHFDFNGFLRLRDLEVKYERCWTETDTIQMRSSNEKGEEEEEMVVNKDCKTENLSVCYKETNNGRRKGSEKVKTKVKK